MKSFKDLGIKIENNVMTGDKIKINRIINKPIEVVDFELNESKFNKDKCRKCLKLQIRLDGELRVVFTGASSLIQVVQKVDKSMLPFATTIIENNGFYQFT